MHSRRSNAWLLSSAIWLLCALGCAADTPPAPPAPAADPAATPGAVNARGIYAVSDVYTFRPDGSVSERTDGKLGDLQKKNGAFDAATNTLHFFGVQNQEVAVQIVIPFAGRDFSARADAIDAIPAANVTFHWIAYDEVPRTDPTTQKPLPPLHLPDVIIPLDGSVNGIKTFSVPQKIKGLPEVANQQGLLLMEIWIPKTTPAGIHTGTVRILEGDTVAAIFNVQVHVLPVALPGQPTFRLDYLCYSSPLKHFGIDSAVGDGAATDLQTTPAAIKVEQQVYKLTLDNRGFLNILPYASQRGNAQYAYPYAGSGADAKIVSYKGFDDRFGDLLDGKLSKFGAPPPAFTLPFNINYPYTSRSEIKDHFDFTPFKKNIPEGPGKNEKLKVWEDTFLAVARQTADHFAEKNWKQTNFEIYFNQKPAKNNRTPWKLDEPVEAADYLGLRYLFNVARAGFAGADKKGVRVINRIDIGHWECDRFHTLDGKTTACYKSKAFNTGNAEKVLKPVVDRWVSGMTHIHAAQHLIADYNTDAVMFDAYGGAIQSYSHGGVFAGMGFINFQLGVEGLVIYRAAFEPPTAVTDSCSLFGGQELGFTGALASRRVKIWRNAVNDYDLLTLARQKDAGAVAALLKEVLKIGPSSDQKYREESKTIQTYFTNNVEDILTLQRIVAALAAGQKPDPGLKLEGFSKDYTGCGAADTIVGYD